MSSNGVISIDSCLTGNSYGEYSRRDKSVAGREILYEGQVCVRTRDIIRGTSLCQDEIYYMRDKSVSGREILYEGQVCVRRRDII